ncbi:F-box domain-containing protein [Histoplasma capsulatum G186AR]|uniref:F-box domain-containing protein n=1 Tax=Ajellomyces capsulatus (strain G186AR / H82 / ATCC MYA-2454 / RMSCC 2432) TaxID=447093 RepID=C0NMJ0_AJECG|nr:F-box domain-containing protein [Histoplasma capsulatum G186AR]EEH07088.1 F-box domain-containing protein [Histoplasma capsulatum G186AR]
MDGPRGILSLSNELLREILDHLAQDPEKCVSVDRRAYLSIESFKRPNPPEPIPLIYDAKNGFQEDYRTDVDRFREVCKRFADLGASYKFSRVVVRFSESAFRKLDMLSNSPHLARHPRNFTKLKISEHHRRLQEQKRLVSSGEDFASLKRAMQAFKSLQHIKVLKVQDETERELLQFIERHDNPLDPLVSLDWKPACAHAVRTLAIALLESQPPINRFSGPQINPQAALTLKRAPINMVSALAVKLTCLEIHFDAIRYVNAEMRELSEVFHTLFMAAKNMEAVHIGFPSRIPLDLRLEDIFHNVYWEKLRAFGIQAWRLDSEEIIEFARRHRRTLRGLRLRDVLLKEGSMWKDVLSMLREEMENLEWVSLRRIDYSNAFDEKWATSADISDIQSFPNSDSEDDDLFDRYDAADNANNDDYESIGDESDGMSSHNGDNGPRAHQIELSPDTATSLISPFAQWTTPLTSISVDELEDNGVNVEYRQRKLWEEWVISNSRNTDNM